MDIVILIIGIVLAVFGSVTLLLPWLQRKGVNVPGFLGGAATVLETAGVTVDGLYGLTGNAGFALGSKIIEYAKQAVEASEQLFKASEIEAGERKQAAADLVYQFIELAGVEITEDIRKVVDGCIEAAVWALPKTKATT